MHVYTTLVCEYQNGYRYVRSTGRHRNPLSQPRASIPSLLQETRPRIEQIVMSNRHKVSLLNQHCADAEKQHKNQYQRL